ncbi:MAG: FkbM family methyltransferase [Syntrophobacteraceae bacterium]|jgi:FkbM family methyltransferase
MNEILTEISERVSSTTEKKDFLDLIFRNHKDAALNGAKVVLFGAGELGYELSNTLRNNGILPVCFCDNNYSKCGTMHMNIPIISFDELIKSYTDSLIILSIGKEQYLESIEQQLLQSGFSADRILCKKADLNGDVAFMHMYANSCAMNPFDQHGGPHEFLHILQDNEQKILNACNLMADKKSKELFIAKLALIASNGHYELFKDFMIHYSEPIRKFGLSNRHKETEEYFYFNNDIIQLSPNEVYVDVGAADGDTVHTFVQACNQNSISHRWIYALEPDPNNYRELVKNVSTYSNISCHELGLWSETRVLRFLSSDNASTKEAAALCDQGDIEVNVVSLDDFLSGGEVTFLKMDPPGNIIPEAIKGAASSIAKYKPKLALGAYHSMKAIFEIPLLVESICPDYKMFLRHNTCHMCDTVLYAIV